MSFSCSGLSTDNTGAACLMAAQMRRDVLWKKPAREQGEVRLLHGYPRLFFSSIRGRGRRQTTPSQTRCLLRLGSSCAEADWRGHRARVSSLPHGLDWPSAALEDAAHGFSMRAHVGGRRIHVQGMNMCRLESRRCCA